MLRLKLLPKRNNCYMTESPLCGFFVVVVCKYKKVSPTKLPGVCSFVGETFLYPAYFTDSSTWRIYSVSMESSLKVCSLYSA